MPYPAKDVVILPQTVATATNTQSSAAEIILPEQFTSAIVTLKVTAISGTTPTLNFYIQEKLPIAASTDAFGAQPSGTAEYSDVISFTQVTTSTGTWVAQVVGGGNNCGAKSDKALAAGSVRSGPLGKRWICAYTIAGTNPSYTMTATARFIP